MSLFDVIFPVQCPGCGQWDVPACDVCLSHVATPRDVAHYLPRLVMVTGDGDDEPLFPVWAFSSYEDTGKLLQAWKICPSTSLDTLIGDRIMTNAMALPNVMWSDSTIHFVPAPSRPARYRSDTYIAGTIADRVAEGFARGATAGHMVSSTMFLPRRGRQRGRTRKGRRERAPVLLAGDFPSRHVVIVDDVATTGATLFSCYQALHQGGHRILGAVCVAAVIPPGEMVHLGPEQVNVE